MMNAASAIPRIAICLERFNINGCPFPEAVQLCPGLLLKNSFCTGDAALSG